MNRPMWFALLLGPPLLCATPGHAQQPESPPPTPAVGAAEAAPAPEDALPAAQQGGQGSAGQAAGGSDLQSLRQELERIRREAEDERRRQEDRIKALEKKVQELEQAKPATPAAPGTPAPNPITTRPGFKARLYGFARADVDMDTRKMFAGSQLPFWALSPADPRAGNRRDGDFTIQPRLSRLGLDTEAPPVHMLGDAKLTGKIEVDFFNILPDRNSATSNSRHFLRIRHAYGQLDWGRSRLLFGQTWELISPLYPSVNYDVLMWNAGNLGDRRPQLRYTWEPKVGRGKASLAVSAGSAGAIDGQDIDADQNLDGEESGRPVLQARAALNQPSWVKGQTWELGLWLHNGAFRFDRARAVGGHRNFTSEAYGLDVRLPILKRLWVQGEAWFGKDLADVRGGVGQNFNAITGEDVHSKGGWAELGYDVTKFYTFGGGFTIDDPRNGDVTPFTGTNQTSVGRTLNRTYYLFNHFNLGSGLLLGADIMFWNTDFRGLPSGSNTRYNIWVQHNF